MQCAMVATFVALVACDDDTIECGTVEDRADDLLRSAQTCDSDDECTLTTLDAYCVDAFLCFVPLSESANLDHVRSEAQNLGDRARECNRPCPIATCAPPELLRLRCVEHRCSISNAPADGGV
jgi:hypothetical protein